MSKALLFGAGGHARVVRSIVGTKYSEIEYATSDGADGALRIDDVFARIHDFADYDLYIAIGDNAFRRALFERLAKCDRAPASCISEHAFVAEDAVLGVGVFIAPGAVVMTQAVLGDDVIVNTHSSVDHDCRVGSHSQLTGGVNLGGTTIIGENCLLGMRSATIPFVTIGDNVDVMAGSLVAKDVDSNVVVGGYPARLIRSKLASA